MADQKKGKRRWALRELVGDQGKVHAIDRHLVLVRCRLCWHSDGSHPRAEGPPDYIWEWWTAHAATEGHQLAVAGWAEPPPFIQRAQERGGDGHA